MARSVLAIIIGYFVMAVFIFATFSCAYLALGADGAFRPGSYDVSPTWIVLSFVLGIAAAVAGGWACAKVATSPNAPFALAGLVAVLGLTQAGYLATHPTEAPGPRTADVPNLQAMQHAQTPGWINFANPVIGAAGVILGSRLARRRSR